ncbi:MAG: hypothetical protein F4003_05780 [Acidimicrobiaceae bacterium]|nr:hypothetical protein [Acidimicrobiaceae bacterium]MYC41610.1 hypothetical protein [Acidimicrobiaceae bacterium]
MNRHGRRFIAIQDFKSHANWRFGSSPFSQRLVPWELCYVFRPDGFNTGGGIQSDHVRTIKSI